MNAKRGSTASSAALPSQRPAAEPKRVFTELSPADLKSLKMAPTSGAMLRAEAQRTAAAQAAVIGDRRLWPALDRRSVQLYLKNFTLRAVGAHIEVWVASDQDSVSTGLEFPPGDCRNDDRVQLTDAQAQLLAQQFDSVIYPREATAFSEPRPRDGSRAQLPARNSLPADYYVSDGSRVVALVDNIRDESFFDVNVRVGSRSPGDPFTVLIASGVK